MLIGIDLLWVRPKICGGTESVIRNLMTGFGLYDDKNEYILFAGKDTAETFTDYEKYSNMKIEICDVESMNRVKRIAWENSNLDKLARDLGVDVMFIPVYSKPNSLSEDKGGIPYVTTIADLQALHFPKYFSKPKIFFAKRSWKKAVNESRCIVTISNFCKRDIIEHYPKVQDRIFVIYAPILLSPDMDLEIESEIAKKDLAGDYIADDINDDILNKPNDVFDNLKERYGIEKDEYFYTVSSMLPHKNLITLINVMKELKAARENIRLVVSGVGGNREDFDKSVEEAGVEDLVIDTGFVSDKERDSLYENCRLFLFPSTFEGFGMPPIEAMIKGAKVVTTKCGSIEEITHSKASYIDDPLSTKEWIEKIKEAELLQKKKHIFPEYELKNVTEEYLELFEGVREK
jgi:glycosyltransferase involved in cell wall biosynthesis